MTDFDFLEIITELKFALEKGQTDNKDFWYIVDHLDERHLLRYLEALSKTKQLNGHDWYQLTSIINLVKYKKIKWSKRQKRASTMMLIKNLNEVLFLTGCM